MKIFFESSVLVPVFYADHPHHEPSAKILTGLLTQPRFSGADGIAVLEQIRAKLTVISLTEVEYVSAI